MYHIFWQYAMEEKGESCADIAGYDTLFGKRRRGFYEGNRNLHSYSVLCAEVSVL